MNRSSSLAPCLASLALLAALLPVGACTSAPVEQAPWLLADTPLDRNAATLATDTADHLDAAEALRVAILAVDGERSVENTLEPYNQLEMHIDAASNECQLLEAVHPDGAVRDAAQKGSQQVSEYASGLSLDRELFEAMDALDVSDQDQATRFAYEKIMREFRRSGVDQDAEARARLAELDAELVKAGQAFDENIRSDVRSVSVDSVDALAGLPADFVAAHQPGPDGKIVINTTYPDYQPVMTYASDMDLRRRLFMEYKNRAWPQNSELLGELLGKRAEKASMLGYDNWPQYATEPLMIGSAEAAGAFIDQISELAAPVSHHDVARVLERKRLDDPSATKVQEYEAGLYVNLVRKASYDFDSQELRPYFEVSRVRQGLFDFVSRMFGLRIVPVKGLSLWHPSVTAWDMFDGSRRIGRFYLDLFPREDKYGHAACFPIRTGVGGQRLPQAALVCNFPDPSTAPDGVALMEFGQVNTFFHEFGHLLHALLSGRRHWMRNSGFNVEWDFVEAPSQMLEEFLLEPEVLRSFAVHYKTGESVPVELVEKLRRSSDFGKGSGTARQMFYAAVSLQTHLADPDGLDTTALVYELQRRYSPFEPVPGTHMECSFGHLNGYSCIYYTYMWSKVIAKDMYSRFAKEGVLNTSVARDYRKKLLEPGGSRPADELVADFLGRPRSFEAYRDWLQSN